MLVVGDREAEEGAVSVRRHREGDEGSIALDGSSSGCASETSALGQT